MYQRQKILLFSAAFFLLLSCHKKNDSPAPPGPGVPVASPSITSSSPTAGGKNTVLTITGTNFSTVASENAVFINGAAALVTAAVTIKKGNLSAAGPTFN